MKLHDEIRETGVKLIELIIEAIGGGGDSAGDSGKSTSKKPGTGKTSKPNTKKTTAKGAKLPEPPPTEIADDPGEEGVRAVFAPLLAAHPDEAVQERIATCVEALNKHFGVERITAIEDADMARGACEWGLALWDAFWEGGGGVDEKAADPYADFDADGALNAMVGLLNSNDIDVPEPPSSQNVDNSADKDSGSTSESGKNYGPGAGNSGAKRSYGPGR